MTRTGAQPIHFGFVAPAFHSHFAAMEALAVTLIERGHRATFFHRADAAVWLRDPRIGFCVVGRDSHPAGSLRQSLRRAANPGSLPGLRKVILDMAGTTAMFCRELPGALERAHVDALIGDQMEAAAGMVAEALGLPWISVACALPVNREAGVPLPVMPFLFGRGERFEHMVQGSTAVYDWMMTPHRKIISEGARMLGLSARDNLHECLSPLAQLSQTVAGFDFPRSQLPPTFHHVGPLRGAAVEDSGARPAADGPDLSTVDPLRPFVFASLGTLQGQRLSLFKRIVKACRRLDAQLLVAHCGGLTTAQAQTLRDNGATWVCAFADQRAVLARADAVISHAGLNTAMDAIAAGTPILAVPIAFDQPGVAARVVHAGVGLRASPRWAGAARLAAKLRPLLEDPAYARRCAELAQQVHSAGGAPRAADIVESVVELPQPVPARAGDALPTPQPAGARFA